MLNCIVMQHSMTGMHAVQNYDFPLGYNDDHMLHRHQALLFTLFEGTHPHPVPPFCNLSSKDIAGYDIMKMKVSQHIYAPLAAKGLMLSFQC